MNEMNRINAFSAFWENIRIFFQGALLSYIALFTWLRPVPYIASKIITPLAEMLFFTFLGVAATGWDTSSFYVVGNAVQAAAVSGIYGVTLSVGGERWSGTLPYLFGTPANRMAIFLGRAFFHIIDGAIGVVLGFMWGVTLLNLDLKLAQPGLLAITIIVTAFSTSGLGLLMGSLSLITRNIMFVNNTVYFSLLILSGANVPIDVLPKVMRAISGCLPLTHGIQATRAIVAGSTLQQVYPLILGELEIGLLYMFIGFFIFHWLEIHAKKQGTLEEM